MVDSWRDRAARRQRTMNAHDIAPRRAQRPIWPEPAIADRIVWEHDGEQPLTTVATAYPTRLVLVHLPDDRWPTLGVWLAAEAVERVSKDA